MRKMLVYLVLMGGEDFVMVHYDLDHEFLRVFEFLLFFFFQAEDGIRYLTVTGVQTCALPICSTRAWPPCGPPCAGSGNHRRSAPPCPEPLRSPLASPRRADRACPRPSSPDEIGRAHV